MHHHHRHHTRHAAHALRALHAARAHHAHRALHALLAALALSAATLAHAQQSPAAAQPAADDADDTIVQMAALTVTTGRDNGYIAADTLSGSRLSTNLLKTPADITILTRQFLDDIGANNLNDAALWLTNSTVTIPTERDYGTNVTFRGLPSGGNTRDYFAYPTTIDEYIVERMEGARGPNTILYGDGYSGGQINTIIKRAIFRDHLKLAARWDTEGSWRATLDANHRVNRHLALRLNALVQRRRTWEDAFFDDRQGAQLTATYRPWKGADIRLEGELTNSKVARMSTSAGFTDNASLWTPDEAAYLDHAGDPLATGLSRYGSDTLVYNPAFGGIANLKGYAFTNGTGLRMLNNVDTRSDLPNFPLIPRKNLRLRPAEGYLGNHTKTASLYYNQTFDTGLVFEIAAQASAVNMEGVNEEWSNGYIDVNNTIIVDGIEKPNPKAGRFYSEKTVTNYGRNPGTIETLRIAAAYPWKTRHFTQTLSAVAQRRISFTGPELYRFTKTDLAGDVRGDDHMVTFRQYWDDPLAPLVYSVQNPDAHPGYGWVMARNTDTHNTLDSIQLNTVGSYLQDKLNLVAGIRHDAYHYSSRNIATYTPAGYPDTYSTHYTDVNSTTTSIGGTLFPIPQVGLFANHSEAFAPNTQNYPDINAVYSVATTLSNSQTLGLRLNLFKGRLVGSAGYYQSQEKKRPQALTTTHINTIWSRLGKPEMQIGGGAYTMYVDTFDYEAYGYEIDLVANPTRHLRVLLNIAFPHTQQNNSFVQSKAYYAAHIAEWQAAANTPGNPNATEINNRIGSIQNVLLTATDGRTVNYTYKHRANAYANYEFTRGLLRGLRLGGGVNMYGPWMIGSPTNAPYDLMYADSYATATLTLAYYRKYKRHSLYAQMNITNLFDYDRPVFVGVGVYQGKAYRNTYQYIEPRKLSLSATLTF
jgi:outer membrane receptor for monomeric catechols